MTANWTNESNKSQSRPLRGGIYAPVPTFFHPGSEDLDILPFDAHIVHLAHAGVNPLVCGSMGEGIHLSHSERAQLIRTGRKALDNAGFVDLAIMAGVGAGSTRETIELATEAAAAGADYAIAIISGYFAGALGANREALKAFWVEVSQKSPIPVMIYNFPGASGGIDLDSDLITELGEECNNICGVKLTCGNIGKLTRIANVVSAPSFENLYPRKNPLAPFLVLGGFADFLVPAALVNGHGTIAGLANVAPYALKKLYDVTEAFKDDPSLLPEVQRLQGIIARGDFTIRKSGIPGTKSLLQRLHGYGGLPRRPLPPVQPSAAEALWNHRDTQDLIKLERALSSQTDLAQAGASCCFSCLNRIDSICRSICHKFRNNGLAERFPRAHSNNKNTP